MAGFQLDGKTVEVTVTVGTMRRVKSQLGIDLMALDKGDPPLLNQLNSDVMMLLDVVQVVATPGMEAVGLKSDDYFDKMDGDVMADSADAFWRAMTDFFQKARMPHLARAVEKMLLATQAAILWGEAEINKMDAEAEVQAALNSATNSPASSASTPSG